MGLDEKPHSLHHVFAGYVVERYFLLDFLLKSKLFGYTDLGLVHYNCGSVTLRSLTNGHVFGEWDMALPLDQACGFKAIVEVFLNLVQSE